MSSRYVWCKACTERYHPGCFPGEAIRLVWGRVKANLPPRSIHIRGAKTGVEAIPVNNVICDGCNTQLNAGDPATGVTIWRMMYGEQQPHWEHELLDLDWEF